jgi:hypothetical protein
MEWPIAIADFEDLTFEYTPEELGIDAKNAAKIEEIKRLRPLSTSQPWGIFFVKFEPKRLPVVALRRILGRVALKNRPTANSADRTAWAADDLLFVSNYGEGDERQISFAHFSQAPTKHDLPTLKVLGWDNRDTPLHLDDVAEKLTQDLAWPDDTADIDAWRKAWSSAFTLRNREVITTSRDLSVRLAELARAIRDRILAALGIETSQGSLTRLMKSFQETLVHDLDADGFADMYAQTIAYGLLSARVADPRAHTADGLSSSMPVTSPFLKELMETFLHIGGRRNKARGHGIDFDELGIGDVVQLLDDANMEAVVRDFGDRNPQEDPVIHFYELFLKEYDAKKRMQRGVFYTPRPVVSYIVRAVDSMLCSEFGLQDGLADVTTWGEIAARNPALQIPDGVSAEEAFVTILDPATGTGTFLVEAIEIIYQRLVDKWNARGCSKDEVIELWNDYVPRYLLPRLYGYELLMAPYAIAHLKIGLKLSETGYHLISDERVRVYLTNALEPASDASGQFESTVPALAHEAEAVNRVKDHQRFTVVIGNPPYSFFTANSSVAAAELIDRFRVVDGLKIQERAPLVLERALQDDFVKFLGLAIKLLDLTSVGVMGVITNGAYLLNPYLRGVRATLLQWSSTLLIVDLGGDVKDSVGNDENVFDIRQPVAITVMAKPVGAGKHTFGIEKVRGSRTLKSAWLLSHELPSESRAELVPNPPDYNFDPTSVGKEYSDFISLRDLFNESTTGVKTARDGVVLNYDKDGLLEQLAIFGDLDVPDQEVTERLGVRSNAQWDLGRARRALSEGTKPELFGLVDYRPFDTKWIYYDGRVVFNPRPLLRSCVWGRDNIVLISARRTRTSGWAQAWVTKRIPMAEVISSADNCHAFPLFTYSGGLLESAGGNGAIENLKASSLGIPVLRDALAFVYAILFSPQYRKRYESRLRTDLPRIPYCRNSELVQQLIALGDELISLHLMDSPKLSHPGTAYKGRKNPIVGRAAWSLGTIWLDVGSTKNQQDAHGTDGFTGVPEAVWNFQVGSYQVCEKWLKDRKGRPLSDPDVAQYLTIVSSLAETLRLMHEIDEVIDYHGGWPDAFMVPAVDQHGET